MNEIETKATKVIDTITHLDINTITSTTNEKSLFTISNGLFFWSIVIIISLVIIVLILTWLLFRREKALQLMAFSISATGLKLSYELNSDEKMKSLAMENIALQNEIKILNTALSNERSRSFVMLITFFFVVVVFYIADKLRFKKTIKTEIDQSSENLGVDNEIK